MNAAQIVKALGGRGDSAPCPVPGHGRGHGDRNHSLSVHDGDDGKLLVKCHGGCPQTDLWATIKDRGLVGRESVQNWTVSKSHAVTLPKDTAEKSADAMAIWEAAAPALHTPAADYLACRGIVIQPPACIRYHPGINTLVALVQAPDGTFSGIQRIYLKTDSRGTWKRSRYSKGIIKGGAVRLTPVAKSLQLTESVEDGLALLQMTGRATWAVPGVWNMVSFEPPPEVREVILAPDHDEAGLEAIEKTVARNNAASAGAFVLHRLVPPTRLGLVRRARGPRRAGRHRGRTSRRREVMGRGFLQWRMTSLPRTSPAPTARCRRSARASA